MRKNKRTAPQRYSCLDIILTLGLAMGIEMMMILFTLVAVLLYADTFSALGGSENVRSAIRSFVAEHTIATIALFLIGWLTLVLYAFRKADRMSCHVDKEEQQKEVQKKEEPKMINPNDIIVIRELNVDGCGSNAEVRIRATATVKVGATLEELKSELRKVKEKAAKSDECLGTYDMVEIACNNVLCADGWQFCGSDAFVVEF